MRRLVVQMLAAALGAALPRAAHADDTEAPGFDFHGGWYLALVPVFRF
jgi:hypothetical protein